MALDDLTKAILAGRYWTPSGHGATVSYRVEGQNVVDQFGRESLQIDQDMLTAVQLVLEEFAKVANVVFEYKPDTTNDPSNPFTTGNDGPVDITYAFAYDPEIFFGKPYDIFVTADPEQSEGPQMKSATISVNELQYVGNDLMPSATDHAFNSLMNTTGIAMGLAWGRGIEEEGFIPGEAEEPQSDIPSAFGDITDTPLVLSRDTGSMDHTLMTQMRLYGSETTVGGNPLTLQYLDIKALQHLYGVNETYNSGDTVYSYNGDQRSETIWDGAGNDTLDFSALTVGINATLTEDFNNVISAGSSRIWIAEGANIENLDGGSAGDIISGSSLANVLRGLSGNDGIDGRDGNDIINGNAGNDTVDGGTGNDVLRGGRDDDLIDSDLGDDFANGNLGNDTVLGQTGSDTLRGGQGDDQINGSSGSDHLYGDLGNDTLTGGADGDVYYFKAGQGVDVIVDFAGAGAAEGDIIMIESDFLSGNLDNILLQLSTFGPDSFINFGDGNIVTIQGVTGLTVDDFALF